MILTIFVQFVLCIFLIIVSGDEKNTNKKFNPYFRHKVEEIEDKIVSEKNDLDDPQGNLVTFLLQNAKEIFNEAPDQADTTSEEVNTVLKSDFVTENPTKNISSIHTSEKILSKPTTTTLATETYTTKAKTSAVTRTPSSTFLSHTDNIVFENLSLITPFDNGLYITEIYDVYTKNTINFNNENNAKYVGKTEKKEREIHMTSAIRNYIGNSSETEGDRDPRRSCILCNNVYSEDCNDPNNKLISSVMCERDDDMCYSMHTPFGIIDRGCFNTNHNMTTYVCSCNLCNYISISEMPFTFDNKRSWSENVIEISRTRHLRKSVFKEMSCLKCEVNTTKDKGDVLDSANCLEGNIGNIPVEDCKPNEICAVKALRADGYIWRGCLRAPLYNYWWSLCDYDLCNYDNIISLYDIL